MTIETTITNAPPAPRRLALALTIFTGFTALVYEVAFQKYLATLLGSHSEATATVLGLFLGGLAIGYALFGRVVRQLVDKADATGSRPRLLMWYGVVEGSIGIFALIFPLLFLAVRALSVNIPHADGGLGFVFDVLLSAVLVLPPTILMGGTIPFLTQALARDMEDATRVHAFVYAFNTAGAFAGALAAGFLLVPRLGLVGVMLAMGVINIAAGFIFAVLDRRTPQTLIDAAGKAKNKLSTAVFGGYAAVAMAVGFAMMTVQTAVIRLGAQAFGSSDLTFAMVVAVFVLCIALGSFAVSAIRHIPRWLLLANQWALVLMLLWLYVRLPDGPYYAHRLRILFTTQADAFFLYQVAAFFGLTWLLAVPVLLSGASLPLLFNHLRRSVGDLGGVAGRLYSWNTIGSLLGALLSGYALLFWFDLHIVFRIAVVAVAASAVLLGLLHASRPSLIATALMAILSGSLLFRLDAWPSSKISPGLFRAYQALQYSTLPVDEFFDTWWGSTKRLFYRDDPTVSVLVTEAQQEGVGPVRSVLVNGKSDSATHGDTPTTGLLGLLPALFADKVETAFVIGYGTGITVGELAQLESTRDVVVAEISTGVIDAAPLFDYANHNASTDPKVTLLRSDAYRALMRTDRSYDVIVSEPSNPWVTGVEMLYSREFLEAARQRLAPGGVFVQWFHQYSTSQESVELVLRTYREAFDDVSVWYGLGVDLLILGFDDATRATDLERLKTRALRRDYAAGLRRAEVESFAALLAHEILPLGVLHELPLEGPLQTLLRPRLHDMAVRAYFTDSVASLPFAGQNNAATIGAENSLLRKYLASTDEASALQQAVGETCKHRSLMCTALFSHWLARERQPGDQYQQAISDARRNSTRAFGGRFNPKNVPALVSVFMDRAPLPQQVRLDEAQRATRYLTAYYHHGVPIYSDRLLEIWQRCVPSDDEPDACREGLAEARELLGQAEEAGYP